MITNEDEWQRVVQRVTTNDNQCYNEWQRVVQRVTTSDKEWERLTTNDNEWQRVTVSGTTIENSTAHFKEWMIAILSMTKTDTLLQGIDGYN